MGKRVRQWMFVWGIFGQKCKSGVGPIIEASVNCDLFTSALNYWHILHFDLLKLSSYADFVREQVGESIIRSMRFLPRFKCSKLC